VVAIITPQYGCRTRAIFLLTHVLSTTATMRGGQSGAYSKVSFAIEPIQLPIVPLSLFSLQSLHTTASRERGADRSRRWLRGGGAAQRTESRGP
jgi:hypothetical protein